MAALTTCVHLVKPLQLLPTMFYVMKSAVFRRVEQLQAMRRSFFRSMHSNICL